MKPTAVLVNTARGAVIDEGALVEALREHRIFAAGLDVFEEEPKLQPGLYALENAVILPHIGSATVRTRDIMARLAAENLVSMLKGQRPATPVNPELWA
jgi:lactate dehydrogenase-like 2-hydroxyacid dehydrogenase